MNDNIILTRKEAREIDRCAIEDFGIPGVILMENAALGVVNYLLKQPLSRQIIICCGKGNNAGDGFAVARHLDILHYLPHIYLFSDPCELKDDAKINYDIIVKSKIPITIVDAANKIDALNTINNFSGWIIDALFGTGLNGNVQSPYYEAIQYINNSNAIILSIDIPSGLDCDTGEVLGVSVIAKHTVTFVAYKKGFLNPQAKKYLGNISIVDIGIPQILLNDIKPVKK